MHLAFVSEYDPTDLAAYSGIPHFLVRALRERVDRLSVVAPLPIGSRVRGRIAKLRHRARGEGYSRQHTAQAARALSEAASAKLKALQPDAVLTPGTLPLFELDFDGPTACWPDATFEANLLFYPEFTTLSDAHVAHAHTVERQALHRATLALFAARYAADSASGYYGVDETAVHVVPYGANLDEVPADVGPSIDARPHDECRLLYVGSGWVRKGGDVALRVAEEMTAAGVPTTLTVAGPVPPVDAHPLLRPTGFLRKSVPAERERLRQLFADSHFLLMPVRAEDYGCVFAEAAAFGLPSVATAVGGVPSAVSDGESGLLVPPRSRPQDIAARLLALHADRAAYEPLAHSARGWYDRVGNWGVASDRALALLEGVR